MGVRRSGERDESGHLAARRWSRCTCSHLERRNPRKTRSLGKRSLWLGNDRFLEHGRLRLNERAAHFKKQLLLDLHDLKVSSLRIGKKQILGERNMGCILFVRPNLRTRGHDPRFGTLDDRHCTPAFVFYLVKWLRQVVMMLRKIQGINPLEALFRALIRQYFRTLCFFCFGEVWYWGFGISAGYFLSSDVFLLNTFCLCEVAFSCSLLLIILRLLHQMWRLQAHKQLVASDIHSSMICLYEFWDMSLAGCWRRSGANVGTTYSIDVSCVE